MRFGFNFAQPKNRGFTLIELIVILAVLGVLSVGLITIINPAGQISKARDVQRKSDLKQIQTALELYYQDNNAYPLDGGFSFGSTWGTYMSPVPQDPGGKSYYYDQVSSNSYRLYADLDRSQDTDRCGAPGRTCDAAGLAAANCGGGAGSCDYSVSSSNLTP